MSWGPTPDQVRAALTEAAPRALSCSEIAEKTGETWEHANHALVTMRREGEVERVSNEQMPRVTWRLAG